MSGGQIQRLTIARALLRNSSVILLDEVTANIDDKNANKVRKLFYDSPKLIIESAHHINNELAQQYGVIRLKIKDQKIIEI